MKLKNLHLINFKNWEELSLDFSSGINCFVGNNGSGKTNILDALHYLSVCKSYFNLIDSQNIRNEEGFFVIEGEFEKSDEDYRIYCGLKRGQKKILRKNKKDYAKLADHIGQFPSVIISPYDRDLIMDGSDVRRKFMDAVISQSNSIYLDNLVRYNKALAQRNALLKFFAANHKWDKESLLVYDIQLEEKANYIFEARKEFVEKLKPRLLEYYSLISQDSEFPDLNYKSQLLDSKLTVLLEQNLQKDKIVQYTTSGIHKDDLEFTLEGRPLRKFGSQGQQKSFLIALKLAQYDFIREKQNQKPFLLLDDIFDKLDEERVSQLVKLVSEERFGQIFITDTHDDRTAQLVKKIDENAKIFVVEKGKLLSEKV